MATYRYVAYSVQEVFNQTFDDADIPLELIAFWASVIGNKLRKLHLEKQDKSNGSMNGTFMSVYDNVPVVVHNTSEPRDEVANRKHVHLPESIVQLDMDGGIEYISYTYDSGCCGTPSWVDVMFTRTTPSRARRLKMNPHEAPRPEHPYFYVVGNNVYLLGVECVAVKHVELGLYTNYDQNAPCDLDSEVPLPEHLIETLIAQLINMGRFALAYPKDRTNDGDDTASDGGNNGFDRRTLGNLKQVPQETEQAQQEQAN